MSTSVQPQPFDPDKALEEVGGPAQPVPQPSADTSRFDPDKALAEVGGPATTSGSDDSGLMSAISHAASGVMYGFDRDIAPAAAWAADKLVPSGPQPSYGVLKNSYAQHLANQQAAHPIASTAGEVAGLIASPANQLVNAGAALVKGAGAVPAIARGLIGGAASGALYGAGNTQGPLLTRAAAALQGAKSAAPLGAVLGPAAEAAGSALDGAGSLRGGQDIGQLAQDMDASIATQKVAAHPYWNAVRGLGDARVSGPEVDDLLNAPDAPRAYAEAQRYMANQADAELPPFPSGQQAASDALVSRIRTDNPGWSEARVQAAAQDPTIVRGYANGTLGGGGGELGPLASGPSSTTRITDAQVPLRGLQAMKEYLNDFIRRGQDSDNGFTVRNAQALQNTLYRAIGAARDQYPAYGQALDASAGYKALQPIRKALGDMLTPSQYMATGVAGGQLTPEQAQTFTQAGRGPGRAIAAKTAGAGVATAAGHPFVGIGLGLGAARDAAKALTGGKLTPDQVQQLVEIAQKERATPALARLMSGAQAASPSRTAGLLPRAAAALAARSSASASPLSP